MASVLNCTQLDLLSIAISGDLRPFPISTTPKTLVVTAPLPSRKSTMSDFPPNLSIRPLTLDDIEQCEALEKKGFPPAERCSREKFAYRLATCPELCLGLFIREFTPRYSAINLPLCKPEATTNAADAEDDDEPTPLPVKLSVVKETLIAHIIATRTAEDSITEALMQMPLEEITGLGHIELSPYIGVHSVVVDPDWQGKSLGTLLLHDYIQKLSNQELGDQVIIIAHEKLIPFYEKIGFANHGKSKCQFGGEEWYDLSIRLIPTDDM